MDLFKKWHRNLISSSHNLALLCGQGAFLVLSAVLNRLRGKKGTVSWKTAFTSAVKCVSRLPRDTQTGIYSPCHQWSVTPVKSRGFTGLWMGYQQFRTRTVFFFHSLLPFSLVAAMCGEECTWLCVCLFFLLLLQRWQRAQRWSSLVHLYVRHNRLNI